MHGPHSSTPHQGALTSEGEEPGAPLLEAGGACSDFWGSIRKGFLEGVGQVEVGSVGEGSFEDPMQQRVCAREWGPLRVSHVPS